MSKPAKPAFDPEQAASLLRALAHPMRLQILVRLTEGELAVSGFEAELGLKQPNLSQQLSLLREAGLVGTRRESKSVVYRLADGSVGVILDALRAVQGSLDGSRERRPPRAAGPTGVRPSVRPGPQLRPTAIECVVWHVRPGRVGAWVGRPLVNSLPAIGSGGLVGFTLGLIGGGGSIVATPLLLYAVGLPPHVAIGTGALAVSTNALVNFGGHARAGNVRWAVAALFAATGAAGALAGSTLGKAFDGGRLILMFAALMLVIGALMLRPRRDGEAAPVPMTKGVAAKIAAMGLGVGLVAGFFGIGGGFLIVPGLVLATGMPTINAIGTSLLAVAAFGLATALNYAASGLVDWPVAAEFIVGGVGGGWLGMRASCHLASQRNALNRVFAGLVFAVALYIMWRSASHA